MMIGRSAPAAVAVGSLAVSRRPIAGGWTPVDSYLVVAFAVSALLFARWYLPAYRAAGGVPQFYQDQFGPAVMAACGRGFVNVDSTSVRAFDDFLQQRVASLRCEDIPSTIRREALSGFHGSSRFLMAAAALLWRARGIDFHVLDALIVPLFAVSVTAAFAAVRLVCGRAVAAVVTLLWMFSYRHLENLPHLRDYSKAPFFMLMLVALAVVAFESRPRRLLAVGALFGAVQGLGFGMRTDVALNFVPFLLVLFAAGHAEGINGLRPRLACAAAAVAVFVVVALPILRTYARDSSLYHVVLLGLTQPYDENLNIGFPRPAYGFPYAHNDSYIETVVRAQWGRLHPADPPLRMVTHRYDVACRDLFFRLAGTFPADMITRGISSLVGIVNLPFSLPDGFVPVGIANHALKSAWETRGRVAQSFYGNGLALITAVITLAGIRSPLYAAVAFFLLLFWGAFPAIEFQGRHIFHFELVVLAATGWGAAMVVRVVAGVLVGRFGRSLAAIRATSDGGLLRAVTAVAIMSAVVATSVVGARAYQIPTARAFVTSYDSAAAVPLAPSAVPLSHDRVRLAVPLFSPPVGREQVQQVLLKAEFDFAQCGHPAAVTPVFRYDVSEPWFSAFSKETPLEDLGVPPTRIFLPVYSVVRNWIVVARFAGVEVPASFAPCVRLARIDDAASLPLLIPVTIAPDWQRKLYQRIRFGSGLGY
jgi:hypothetical protein